MKSEKIDFIEVLRRWGIGEANSLDFGYAENADIVRKGLNDNNLYYLIFLLMKRSPLINHLYGLNLDWCLMPFNFIYKNFENIEVIKTPEWNNITGGTYKLNDALNFYLNFEGENKVKTIIGTLYNMHLDDFSGLIITEENGSKFRIYEGNSRLTAIYKYYKENLNLDFLNKTEVVVGFIK